MSSFTKSRRSGKRSVYVWAETPECALEQLDRHLQNNLINADNYVRAVLCYHGTSNADSKDPNNYALKFYTKYRNEELWISGVAAGSKCMAAHATHQCLLLMGFIVEAETDIYNLPVGEKKTFVKKMRR